MLPSLFQDNATYRCLINTELFGEVNLETSLIVQSANFDNICGSEFCVGVSASTNIKQPVLARVLDIFQIGDVLKVSNMVVALVPVNVIDVVFSTSAPNLLGWRR